MGSAAVVKAFADINAAIAVLTAEVDGARVGASDDDYPLHGDPLQGVADGCLDILAGIPGAEARFAALKARAATKFTNTTAALAPPDAPAMPREASVAAEIACILTIGPRAATALLSDSHELITR